MAECEVDWIDCVVKRAGDGYDACRNLKEGHVMAGDVSVCGSLGMTSAAYQLHLSPRSATEQVLEP